MGSLISLGLAQILVGAASPTGVMPSMTKIGKTYKDSCKYNQAAPEVTEHKEEGKASPEYRDAQLNIPVLTFSIMDPDPQFLADYVGGAVVNGKWGMNGTEKVLNRAIQVQTKVGMWIDIPNGSIQAVINAEFSSKGILLVDFTVTPLAVSSGYAISMYDGAIGLTLTPTSLSFTAAADATGKTTTATSTGNVTYAAAPADTEWLTVTRALKVVTVKVAANTNSEARTAVVTIVADGITGYATVTQAGV